MMKNAMQKISIKKYQEDGKFWNDIAVETVKVLRAAATYRREIREEAGLEVSEDTKNLAYLGVCGGSTPVPLYKLLGNDKNLDLAKTEVYLVDERLVKRDDLKSNSRMIRETLYAGENEIHLSFFHDFITELPVEETILQYGEEFSLVPEEQLDVVILGVGPDGHFASVFPGELSKSKQIYDDGEVVFLTKTKVFDVKDRITLTAEIIKKSKRIFIVMKGKEKLSVLEEIENGKKSAEEFPVKFLTEGDDNKKVTIYYCE